MSGWMMSSWRDGLLGEWEEEYTLDILDILNGYVNG